MLWISKNRTRSSQFSLTIITTTTTTYSQTNIRAVKTLDVQSVVFKDARMVPDILKLLNFDECDANKDGLVSFEEFVATWKKDIDKKIGNLERVLTFMRLPEGVSGKTILRIVKKNVDKGLKKIAKPLFEFCDLDGNGTIQKHEANILLLPMALTRIGQDIELLQKLTPNFFFSVVYLLFDQNDDGDITKDEIVKRVSGFLSSITRVLIELIDFV